MPEEEDAPEPTLRLTKMSFCLRSGCGGGVGWSRAACALHVLLLSFGDRRCRSEGVLLDPPCVGLKISLRVAAFSLFPPCAAAVHTSSFFLFETPRTGL